MRQRRVWILGLLCASGAVWLPRGACDVRPAESAPTGREGIAADARLDRPLTLAAEARPLGEWLPEIARELGVLLEADRDVADDKVCLYLRQEPAGEALARMASWLGYHWVARRGGYELRPDLAAWQARAAAEAEAGRAALARLPETIRLYETHLEKDPETLERIRHQAEHNLRYETDPARRQRLQDLRRVAADLSEPGVRMFLQVWKRAGAEARPQLAAGRTASIRVEAKSPEEEEITFEVQIRQVVEGRRAALVFRAPEALVPGVTEHEKTIIEWRLTPVPPATAVPGAGRRAPGAGLAKRGTRRPAPAFLSRRVSVAPERPTIGACARALAGAAGISVIADGYTRPLRLPPPRPESVEQWLAQLCERNEYTWEAEGGRILLRSAQPALDRRREAPERLLRPWREEVAATERLSPDRLAEVADRLTDDQLEVFEERWPLTIGGKTTAREACGGVSPWISRAGLRFYASLAPGQRQEATLGALPFARLLPEQRRRFAAVFAEDPYTGQPAIAAPEQIAAGAFRLRREQRRVLLAGRGSREWEEVEETEAPSPGERPSRVAGGQVYPRLSRVEFAFHIGGQEAPRVTFRYEELPREE